MNPLIFVDVRIQDLQLPLAELDPAGSASVEIFVSQSGCIGLQATASPRPVLRKCSSQATYRLVEATFGAWAATPGQRDSPSFNELDDPVQARTTESRACLDAGRDIGPAA